MAIRVYSNEEKSVAQRSMNIDPVVLSYTKAINNIITMWSFPKIVKIGESIISDGIPDMPSNVQSVIDNLEKQREGYIKNNYPELFSL